MFLKLRWQELTRRGQGFRWMLLPAVGVVSWGSESLMWTMLSTLDTPMTRKVELVALRLQSRRMDVWVKRASPCKATRMVLLPAPPHPQSPQRVIRTVHSSCLPHHQLFLFCPSLAPLYLHKLEPTPSGQLFKVPLWRAFTDRASLRPLPSLPRRSRRALMDKCVRNSLPSLHGFCPRSLPHGRAWAPALVTSTVGIPLT